MWVAPTSSFEPLNRIAQERAGHAMTAAAAFAKFKPRDGDDLHPSGSPILTAELQVDSLLSRGLG